MRTILWRTGLALGLLFLSSASPAQNAQRNASVPDKKYSVTSRLVVVDVVVRHEGQPVCGLSQQDFDVRESGHPQAIESFEAHCASRDKPAGAPPQLPPNTYTDIPFASPAGAVNVLLLDGLNTKARDGMRARAEMIASLKTLPPGRRIAIFTLGSRLQMLAGFTTDTDALVKALTALKAPPPSTMLPPEQEKALEEETIDNLPPEMKDVTRAFLNDADNQQGANRMRATLAAFQQLARYLAGIPGRKNLLWFSGSFPIQTFQSVTLPDGMRQQQMDQSYGGEVRRTANLLADARVAVYPVDVRGAISEPIYDLRQQQIVDVRETLASEQQEALEQIAERGTLESVAKETGGRAIYESNDLAKDMTGALEDGSDYYTLAYSPADKSFNGAWRDIRVGVSAKPAKGKFELSYRNGYFALPDEQPAEASTLRNAFAAAMREGMPSSSQILFDVRVTEEAGDAPAGKVAGQNTNLEKRAARYHLDFAARLKDVTLSATPDGSHTGDLVVNAVAYNRDGLVVNSAVDGFRYQVDREHWQSASAKGLQIHQLIDLPAGEFQLRMGIYDPASGRIGTVEIPLHVSPAKITASAQRIDAVP